MKQFAFFLFLLSACIPRPNDYCSFTCLQSNAEWQDETMEDPNDPERIPWCVCVREELDGRTVFRGSAPQDPNQGD